jgi:hypothetical protein
MIGSSDGLDFGESCRLEFVSTAEQNVGVTITFGFLDMIRPRRNRIERTPPGTFRWWDIPGENTLPMDADNFLPGGQNGFHSSLVPTEN